MLQDIGQMTMAGKLRITGGRLVRRKFNVPKEADAGSVRPATDMIREAIFSSLGSKVHHAKVLDPFGGSGAYGFESLSRWAKEVTVVEKNRRVLDNIRDNAEHLDVTQYCNFNHQDALVYVQKYKGEKFDLVFLDPPFDMGLTPETWHDIYKLLADDGIVVFRCQKKADTNIPENFLSIREKVYGQSLVIFLVRD